MAYRGACDSSNMHSRARVLSVNVSQRTASLFLIDEGLEREDSWDSLDMMPIGRTGHQEVRQPGLAIKIELACLAALPLGATDSPRDRTEVVYTANRCCKTQFFLGGQNRSLNEELMAQGMKLGGLEAVLQGLEYEQLPRGAGTHYIMSYKSHQLMFVVIESSLEK